MWVAGRSTFGRAAAAPNRPRRKEEAKQCNTRKKRPRELGAGWWEETSEREAATRSSPPFSKRNSRRDQTSRERGPPREEKGRRVQSTGQGANADNKRWRVEGRCFAKTEVEQAALHIKMTRARALCQGAGCGSRGKAPPSSGGARASPATAVLRCGGGGGGGCNHVTWTGGPDAGCRRCQERKRRASCPGRKPTAGIVPDDESELVVRPAAGSTEQQPSPASTYRGLYALTVRWQPPVPRGEAPRHRKDSAALPKDPRQWSREDVAVWLVHVMDQHRLPAVSTDRFLMNGKALCLMTMEMFVQRVPLGGKLLYKDFQLRLSNVLYN
ncbi:hypothetical protein HPB49_026450 [Dermacentor silvarum]|nr:hypothetical protein HPB49_026450 [Dermacentor silvarum]